MSDSRAEPGGRPLHFTLGDHQVFKCFDIAIPQLKEGATATLHCPSFYAWGAAFTQSPLGGEPIPLNSDVEFQIDVIECNRVPKRAQKSKEFILSTPTGVMYFDGGYGAFTGPKETVDRKYTLMKFEEDGIHVVPVWLPENNPDEWAAKGGNWAVKWDPATKVLEADTMAWPGQT